MADRTQPNSFYLRPAISAYELCIDVAARYCHVSPNMSSN